MNAILKKKILTLVTKMENKYNKKWIKFVQEKDEEIANLKAKIGNIIERCEMYDEKEISSLLKSEILALIGIDLVKLIKNNEVWDEINDVWKKKS